MSLAGRTIAISIGGAPDLAKLGFPPREVERALLSVCGALIRAGARIAYGGDFRADGFTVQMYRHLAGSYADHGTKPFRHYLAEPSLRRARFEDLVHVLQESQAVAETVAFLGPDQYPLRASAGALLFGKGVEGKRVDSPAELASWLDRAAPTAPGEAYSRMRVVQSREADGRVAMGGKMGLLERADDAYEGAMPGIAQEALLTLRAGKPFIPLAAYGGAARDVAIALGLLEPSVRTPRGAQAPSYTAAMVEVADLASAIPPASVVALKTIVRTERIETLANLTVSVLENWIPPVAG